MATPHTPPPPLLMPTASTGALPQAAAALVLAAGRPPKTVGAGAARVEDGRVSREGPARRPKVAAEEDAVEATEGGAGAFACWLIAPD